MKFMNPIRGALGVAALLLGLSQAHADFNANQATGTQQVTLCGFSVTSVILPCHVIVDSTKAEMFKAANPGMVALTFGGSALTLGQKAMAGSIPVVLPSDGTLPLPTGAATAALQTTGNTSLATLATASAAQATAANQATANNSLASIDTKATTNNSSLTTIATNTAGLATAAAQAAANTKLDTLIGQAPQVTAPGGVHTQMLGVEGADGMKPLLTQSGTAIASPAYRIGIAAAGNNAQVFTPSGVVTPKKMLHAYFCNKAASDRVLKFYDKATAPVPGTDAIVTSIVAPAGACPVIDFSSGGFPFANGVAVAITAAGDGDTGSTVAAGDIVGLNIQHN